MTRKVIDIVVQCEVDEAAPPETPGRGSAQPADHEAMLQAVHAALSQLCPGLSFEALESMLTAESAEQAIESAYWLDHPKGSA